MAPGFPERAGSLRNEQVRGDGKAPTARQPGGRWRWETVRTAREVRIGLGRARRGWQGYSPCGGPSAPAPPHSAVLAPARLGHARSTGSPGEQPAGSGRPLWSQHQRPRQSLEPGGFWVSAGTTPNARAQRRVWSKPTQAHRASHRPASGCPGDGSVASRMRSSGGKAQGIE